MAYRDNVEITEESYVPGGFGVEDYLIPNKPNIDWRDVGVSYAGGLSYAPDESSISRTFAGEQPQVDPDDIDLDDVQRKRTRRSSFTNTMMTIADLLKISASMPNTFGQSALKPGSTYLGMTEEEANNRAEIRMKEDPEGYQIDMNRAKVLSQRASETDDVELKKKYGAAIKTLLPEETQGLDDLTASTFLFSQSDKLQQQLLKNAGNLAVQQTKNAGNLATAGVKADSAENIANIRADASRDVANISGQYGLAKKDKDYLREQLRQAGMNERQADKLIADYEREYMKQGNMNYRTEYAADRALEGRVYAADQGLEGRRYTADSAFDRNKYTVDASLIKNQRDNERAIQVALINADSRIQAAKAKGALGGVDVMTGDIVPSGGVVEAMNFIEKNKDLFSATNALLDTKLGRASGALTDETIQARDNVRQELQTLVQQSVKNLMQLFPKGGSGVINTATEQRFFVPVAEAIASGEANKIIPAVKAFYGQMYDACAAAGEPAPISRSEYIRLMTTGMTSDGRTRITRSGGMSAPAQQTTNNYGGVRTKDGLVALTFD